MDKKIKNMFQLWLYEKTIISLFWVPVINLTDVYGDVCVLYILIEMNDTPFRAAQSMIL